jgi:hypothetical protein
MITLAVIGLAMTLVTGGATLLPQTRLRGSANRLMSALESARTWAVLEGHTLEFCYDLENRTCAFWLPYETDDEGKEIGPGRTYRSPPEPLYPDISIAMVRLAGGETRDKGQVIFEVSPMGRVPPHEVVVVNDKHPDTEVMTVRVNGLSNRTQVLKGDVTMETVGDADFQ